MIIGHSSNRFLRFGLLPAAAALLVACEDGAFQPGGTPIDEPGAGSAVEFEEREVEAPEVFQVTEKALWDGRPSLGGVWVAHPDSKQPERVMMVNTSNGKFVVGALFRRDTTLPGPKLQLSSDAATALEILAGAPTEIRVTALRRETVQVSVAEEPGQAEPTDGPEAVATTALAAIDAADAPDAAEKTAVAVATPAAPSGAPATTASAKPAAGGLSAPYIQIGFYSIEGNAGAAAADLKKLGIAASIANTTIKGKPFWRVLAGPAATRAERDKILKSVKGIGYSDAYAVKG